MKGHGGTEIAQYLEEELHGYILGDDSLFPSDIPKVPYERPCYSGRSKAAACYALRLKRSNKPACGGGNPNKPHFSRKLADCCRCRGLVYREGDCQRMPDGGSGVS